jgi:hypothetical protein
MWKVNLRIGPLLYAAQRALSLFLFGPPLTGLSGSKLQPLNSSRPPASLAHCQPQRQQWSLAVEIVKHSFGVPFSIKQSSYGGARGSH